MSDNYVSRNERRKISKGIVAGAVTGGILGAVAAFLIKIDVLIAPGIGFIIAAIPFDISLAGAALGILVGGGIANAARIIFMQKRVSQNGSYLNDNMTHEQTVEGMDSKAILRLLEEKLDISKEQVKTGEVNVHKEVFTDEKSIIVPVVREELVIEKKVFDAQAPDKTAGHTETIRIPISEEHIEIIKHPVTIEEVKIYKQQVHDTEHVETTLKKEKISLDITGDAEVMDGDGGEHQ